MSLNGSIAPTASTLEQRLSINEHILFYTLTFIHSSDMIVKKNKKLSKNLKRF
nr:hypothetical protein TnSNPV_125 [Trichoplusia ni single nucleopolyhedrovirus]